MFELSSSRELTDALSQAEHGNRRFAPPTGTQRVEALEGAFFLRHVAGELNVLEIRYCDRATAVANFTGHPLPAVRVLDALNRARFGVPREGDAKITFDTGEVVTGHTIQLAINRAINVVYNSAEGEQ